MLRISPQSEGASRRYDLSHLLKFLLCLSLPGYEISSGSMAASSFLFHLDKALLRGLILKASECSIIIYTENGGNMWKGKMIAELSETLEYVNLEKMSFQSLK